MKQGWNKSGHIKGDALDPFFGSGGPLGGPSRAPEGPQMAQNGHFGAITGSVGSELVEQCGIKVEQVRAHPGQCNGTVSLVKGGLWGAPIGPQKGPKWPKIVILVP